jgi:hypothetical protein
MRTLASLSGSVYAIAWEPEIRGITIVAIAVAVLCGSVYLVLATNLGSRLGLLVTLAGLFGWMALMGGIWWIYGIGLRGTDPTWQVEEIVFGDITQSTLEEAHVLADPEQTTWRLLPEDDPGRGQTATAADEALLNNTNGRFPAGSYITQAVYATGGETYPDWFFNFWHEPHYAVVQVQPTIRQATEPGKAPPTPQADPNQPPVYIVLVRDLGDRRVPAALITLASTAIFGVLCNILHRRDKVVRRHLSGEDERGEKEAPVPARVGADV